jgi:undecaprenyl diphosphate synthase
MNDLDSSKAIPRHVAIVMDGNGRWAKRRFLPRVAGHRQGIEALRRAVSGCIDRNVGVLTVFAFSSENWNRPPDEVSGLMDLMALALSREVPTLHAKGVQLHFPGDRSTLSRRVVAGLTDAEALTSGNHTLVLNVCFNYGGQWDVCQAAERLRQQGTPITTESLSRHLALAHVPDPDLCIRTGGEMRISNFLIWQLAYSEFYFSDVLWPDFDEAELDNAFNAYRQRERRFGLTSEQRQNLSVSTPMSA